MKTLKRKIEDRFNTPFNGHPLKKEEHDIDEIKWAILELAQAIDNIIQY